MKEIIAAVIARGNYDLSGLIRKINECNIAGEISDQDRDDLIAAARGEAVPGMDVKSEIQQLWAAVNDLRKMLADKSGEIQDGVDTPDEYIAPTGAHDAYYAGALVRYNGKVYQCIAPAGMACVWSPDVMPSYWEEV